MITRQATEGFRRSIRVDGRQSQAGQGAAVRGVVPEGMVRMAPVMALPSLLHEFRVDPAPLLAGCGLEPGDLDEPEHLISFEGRSQLLARCAEAARCPHLGLLLGQRAGMSTFGPVGFLMQSAPDMRSALALGMKYFRLHNPNSAVRIDAAGGYLRVSFDLVWHDGPGRDHVVDLSAAIMGNALRALSGHRARFVEVQLARRRPKSTAPYQRLFDAPLTFDASDTGVLMSAAWLDRPLPTADPLLHRMMQRYVAELARQGGEDLVGRLRLLLPALIAGGSAHGGEAARRLGLGVRTLNRRLAAAGTSFAALRDEARYAAARQLLGDTSMPVNEIATQLGYANASAFTAAFRRWSGTGPSRWRSLGD
jgi:AraC-like DNA-binding protein